MRMIILAAGQGTRLRPLTDTQPKCLVPVHGRPLLDWQIASARQAGIDDIVVVRGYLKDAINRPDITVVDNPRYDSTNMVSTLWCATSFFDEEFIVSYGDIIYEPRIIEALLADPSPIGVVVDTGWRAYWERRFDSVLEDAETLVLSPDGCIMDIGKKPASVEQIHAQYIGLTAYRKNGVDALRDAYDSARAHEAAGQHAFSGNRPLSQLYMTDLIQGIIDSGFPVRHVPVHRGWLEIDSPTDLEIAEQCAVHNNGRLEITS